MQKLLAVLVLGTLLVTPKLEAEARGPPYGVKLCGREFIRAVIFTCGGSRWRRAGDPDALNSLLGGDESSEAAGSSEWDPGRLLERWQGRGGRGGLDESWAPPRGPRDVVTGLSAACCRWGCSKSEISSLC
ncbi:relaxin-3 [Alligator sinensis]|uniref:Relaxin-3 n=1 Tax=Alligator sinensis TaxID=38654 RepID=A0A1U7RP86_ALLSI|nr:relaxin-3 [Alligator sinensis]